VHHQVSVVEFGNTVSLKKQDTMNNRPLSEQNSLQDAQSGQQSPMLPRLLVVAVCMVAGTTLFEATKQMLLPAITVWQSHILTIVFSTVAALFVAFLIARRSDRIIKRISEEIAFRRETERKLRLSEEKLSKIFQANPDWIIISSLYEGEYIEINDAVCRISGYSREEIQGHTSLELNIWADPEDRKAMIPILLHEGRISNHEVRFRMKSGEIRHMLRSAELINLDGRAALISVCKDITGRKLAEEALQQSEKRLRLFLDASPNMYYLKDPSLRYLLVNAATVRYFQRPETEIIGRTESELMPGETAKRYEDTDQQAMQQKQTVTSIENVGDKTYETYKFPVLVKDELCGVAGIIRDITEGKRLQMQLTQAQKMESVGRLAGGVAHDFNNMLGVILGHTEMALKRLNPSEPLYANLQEIGKAAARSADLTRQLLAFARKQTMDPKILDLNETVGGMITMLHRMIGEDITLTWLPGKGLGLIMMDPSQIDQVLANLCVNARDAIKGVGKITIETEAATLDDAYCAGHPGAVPGEYVVLIVSDNGCGMDKATQAHVFEPFFTTKEMGKGTGLGLATIYGIIKQNSGFINVYSEPDQGTVVRIYLPRYTLAADMTPNGEGPGAPIGGTETILLVEDESMILNLATHMLISQGYHILPAATPQEAIRLARKYPDPIHLLITDVVMPEMNGRELARVLASFLPGLKLLFMSGYTANVIAHHGVLDEGVHFIQKPFTLEQITAKIREALAGNPA
jgi:two-component system cell cycle sensor histidine kinase/response regulator CckA